MTARGRELARAIAEGRASAADLEALTRYGRFAAVRHALFALACLSLRTWGAPWPVFTLGFAIFSVFSVYAAVVSALFAHRWRLALEREGAARG